MPLVLGVDCSTQSTKVEVRDADDGTLVASGRAPHPPAQPPRSEQPPTAWWEALRTAIAAAGRTDIAAIAVAGQQHGMVVLDRTGRVLRNAKLWNDTESAPQAADMTLRMDPASWARAVGSVPVASFTITKLAWLAHHEPSTLDQVATILLPHDYLGYRLTGRIATDRGDASGTGYFDPSTGAWRPDLLDRFVSPGPWADRLPTVLGPLEPNGHLSPAAGDDLGVTGQVLVGPGTGDNMAAALGLGLAPGDMVLSLGTSGTAFMVSPTPTADPSGAVAGFADATGRYLPLVCTLNATKVTDTVARLLGVDAARLDALAHAAPAGAGGLVLVPHLDGERTPNRPDATGTLTGIRSDTTPERLARAAFEGVVCNLLAGADRLPTGDGRLVLVGGGARSAAYRQIVADLAQRPVHVPAADELVAQGAAVQAAAILKGAAFDEITTAWDLHRATVTDPDPSVDAAALRTTYQAASTSAD